MTLRAIVPILALVALTTLSACGFRPLYATAGDDYQTAANMAQVKVELIDDRVGQLTRNALLETLTPRGQSSNPLYDLSVTLTESTSEQGFTKDNEATIADYLIDADYQLVRRSDSKVLRNGTVRARTSYNIVDSDFASIEAEDAARKDAARNLAQQLANQVAIGLRSQ
ncbi:MULTISPECIES: LPS assembly lipoprotein LptE [unclassified Thalassospira]|uniref:LPS assembly lipoprotein LptE n=1 Tax=unclassified Thalassospira TaxID=2648997 RepID=UPI0025D2F1D3|nr:MULTISPECIES: LPS assembly lipoprotein LptE [unclassified Thalassospira]|tara:strand:- start:2349 stop:2855 length:507 start_codon:yes stop_codon:yes gene_type:complete